MSRFLQICCCLVMAIGFFLLIQAAYIPLKAYVAQILLNIAWEKTLEDGAYHKPWPWADLHPVAEISFPKLKANFIVLNNDTGSALAFGPGANAQTIWQEDSAQIISGHRDTHFSILQHVNIGDQILLTSKQGSYEYQVLSQEIVDASKTKIMPMGYADHLFLVTCYPFNAIQANGNLRLFVVARKYS